MQIVQTGKIDFLRSCYLFSDVDNQVLEELLEFAKIKSHPPSTVLFYQGEKGSQLYVILSGRVQINVTSKAGKELIVGILSPGETFGEIAVFSEVNRIATVKTLEQTQLLTLEREKLLPYLKNNPEVAIKIIGAQCKRLVAFNADVEEILFYDLPIRLAKKLVAMMKIYGEKNNSGTIINFRFSQTTLGNMLSVSRESINRQIRIWEQSGLLSYEQGVITIKEENMLKEIAATEPC